ncbi:universal stress protein [Picosynechococcus sp. NKBG15041c]|uniref:universal stress protein n=1 Tax=Picosynechococcus sp. NKBG15041c TaxID=1407650 RepID=UPI000406E9C5|nr:universal stress protein [Picosynechococcus sp. NKBG15041c]
MLPTSTPQDSPVMGIQKILVALDYPSENTAIFDQALNFAEKFQAELTIFHCIQPQPVVMPEIGALAAYGGMIDTTAIAQQEEQFQRHVDNVTNWLQSLADKAHRRGIPHTTTTHQIGDPNQAICAIAKQNHIHLIILGRRGLSGLGEIFLGSVSNYVLHHAPCSVLIVQPSPMPEVSVTNPT